MRRVIENGSNYYPIQLKRSKQVIELSAKCIIQDHQFYDPLVEINL